jgi:GT2 family glycosyltransferase
MQTLSLPFVFIVIVNWNGKELLLECLAALDKPDYPKDKYKVLVVDNASADGSQAAVARFWPDALLLENKKNEGYARAVNQGIDQALRSGADFVWIFNNDVLVEQGTLRALIRAGESDEKIGVLAPVIHSFDDPERVEHAGYKINFWIGWLRKLKINIDVFKEGKVSDVDSVLGCSNLIKSSVFKKIGFLRPV